MYTAAAVGHCLFRHSAQATVASRFGCQAVNRQIPPALWATGGLEAKILQCIFPPPPFPGEGLPLPYPCFENPPRDKVTRQQFEVDVEITGHGSYTIWLQFSLRIYGVEVFTETVRG